VGLCFQTHHLATEALIPHCSGESSSVYSYLIVYWPETTGLPSTVRPLQGQTFHLGLGRIGWHTFRHSHSSLLHALGVDLKVQQELLRHADIRTTMNIYTHAVPAALREANSKVVNLVLPAQVACELNAPLSSLENLQLTVKKGNIGRGGGDRTQRYALLSY